jgi:hypothetical protein
MIGGGVALVWPWGESKGLPPTPGRTFNVAHGSVTSLVPLFILVEGRRGGGGGGGLA